MPQHVAVPYLSVSRSRGHRCLGEPVNVECGVSCCKYDRSGSQERAGSWGQHRVAAAAVVQDCVCRREVANRSKRHQHALDDALDPRAILVCVFVRVAQGYCCDAFQIHGEKGLHEGGLPYLVVRSPEGGHARHPRHAPRVAGNANEVEAREDLAHAYRHTVERVVEQAADPAEYGSAEHPGRVSLGALVLVRNFGVIERGRGTREQRSRRNVGPYHPELVVRRDQHAPERRARGVVDAVSSRCPGVRGPAGGELVGSAEVHGGVIVAGKGNVCSASCIYVEKLVGYTCFAAAGKWEMLSHYGGLTNRRGYGQGNNPYSEDGLSEQLLVPSPGELRAADSNGKNAKKLYRIDDQELKNEDDIQGYERNYNVNTESHTRLKICNAVAVGIHIIMFIACLARFGEGRLEFETKYDRSQLIFVPRRETALEKGLISFQNNMTDARAASCDNISAVQLNEAYNTTRWADFFAGGRLSVAEALNRGLASIKVSRPASNESSFVKNPFLQLNSPYTGNKWADWDKEGGATIADKCPPLAKPTRLDFVRDPGNESMWEAEIWTYPADANYRVQFKWIAIGFFTCSWFFQIINHIMYDKWLFDMEGLDDGSQFDIITLNCKSEIQRTTHGLVGQVRSEVMISDLRFNFMRFIEYSLSGTLVLLSMALVSGIVDKDILTCITVMSGVCMLLGITGEAMLRVSNILKQIEDAPKLDESSKNVIMRCREWTFWAGYVLPHVLGWLCILPPLAIILNRNMLLLAPRTMDGMAATLFFPLQYMPQAVRDYFQKANGGAVPNAPDFVMVRCRNCIMLWNWITF